MKELKSSGDSNREIIQQYLESEDGTVELTEKQKELLMRWEYTDEQIRKNEMKREVLAQLLQSKFKISRHTAYQDIVNAEAVFSSSAPLNKKYRIGLRIEYLERKIEELHDASQYVPAAMLEKVLAKYYELYPDIAIPRSPKNIIYNIQYNNLNAAPMDAVSALDKAKKFLSLKPRETDGTA